MANQPKEAERRGYPLHHELASAVQRDGVDAKAHPSQRPGRTIEQAKSSQPLGTYTEAHERASAVDLKAHPSGGRRLLKDADSTVHPLVPSMVVKG